MSGNSALELNLESSWRAGLNNLLRAEFKRWWKTSRWWKQILIWVGTVDLILFMILFAERSEGGPSIPPEELLILYNIFGGMFVTIGVIILMQGAIVGEKLSGTAAWVLSKPASRTAFVVSKMAASAFGVAITAVLVPGLIAYGGIASVTGNRLAFINFLGGMGVFFLFALFWLAFTLMLGAFYNSRGPVIGIPMGLILGQQFVIGLVMRFVPWMYNNLPYQLVMPLNDSEVPYTAAIAVITGTPLDSWTPVYSTVIFILLFTAVGIWRFSREEF